MDSDKSKWQLIKAILKEHCKFEQNITLNWAQKGWMTFKAILSVLFAIDYEEKDKDGFYTDDIQVASWGYHEGFNMDGQYADWTQLDVAYKGFGYQIIDGGWP
jgi:hypothetical protein